MTFGIRLESNKEKRLMNEPKEDWVLKTFKDDEFKTISIETKLGDCKQLWYSTISIITAWEIIETINKFDGMWLIMKKIPSLMTKLLRKKPKEEFRFQLSIWTKFIMDYIMENGF